jgi:hypothetical protein
MIKVILFVVFSAGAFGVYHLWSSYHNAVAGIGAPPLASGRAEKVVTVKTPPHTQAGSSVTFSSVKADHILSTQSSFVSDNSLYSPSHIVKEGLVTGVKDGVARVVNGDSINYVASGLIDSHSSEVLIGYTLRNGIYFIYTDSPLSTAPDPFSHLTGYFVGKTLEGGTVISCDTTGVVIDQACGSRAFITFVLSQQQQDTKADGGGESSDSPPPPAKGPNLVAP